MSAHIVEANTCLHENDKNSSSSLELSTKPQLHTAVFTTELQSVTQGGNKEAGGAPVLSRHYPPPLSRGDEELHLDNITSPLSNPPSGARFNANPAMERRGTDDHSEYPTTIASHRRDNPYVVVANNECFSRGPNRCNNPLQFSTTTNSTNPLEISLETCQSRYHDVVTPVGDVVLPLNTDLTSLPSASSTSMRLMLTCDGYSEGEGPQLEDSVVLDPFAVPLGRSALSTSVKRLLTEMTGGLNVDFLVDMFYCSDDTLTEGACEQYSWASSKTLVCMVLLLNL
ncbi:hypothetical protein AGDE_15707 [Angomonas deanei]|uniref:Uncharacterized protein n=1 Tax=Angomonas deanei TaxID=59799 RepID=A0A7G2CB97_9TRYP|nr:hypothetical protein AGDE_15707 [Angomonas deanei]CAD2216187.1 hypothetical protein, conserved [Angomonas deanei]|eukprot:EPY18599.1 hypothetical protein AGDE_15707 [Angomonas deanei]